MLIKNLHFLPTVFQKFDLETATPTDLFNFLRRNMITSVPQMYGSSKVNKN